MHIALSFIALTIIAGVSASHTGPLKTPVTTLVSFGDSYTDQIRISNGGTQWPVYASGYGHFSIIDVAVFGATCNQSQVNRPFPIFPYQLNDYLNRSRGMHLDFESTVFSIWIGTNDVGIFGLFNDNQAPGVSIVDVTYCSTIEWVSTLYHLGARNFVLQNMLPLDKMPAYYNQTFIYELVMSGNEIARLNALDLATKYIDARICVFDSHSLFTDMINNPSQYLNGTDPLNVVGDIVDLKIPAGPRRDSYLWYDAFHPSEQADRIVAREIVRALKNTSKFAKWLTPWGGNSNRNN